MNIITHEKAYALYGKASFQELRSLMYSTEGVRQDSARRKYAERGWLMTESLTTAEIFDPDSSFKPGPRYVGDPLCWTVDLTPKLDLEESLIEMNNWVLRYDNDNLPSMEFDMLEDNQLGFEYVFRAEEDGPLGYIRPALCEEGPRYDLLCCFTVIWLIHAQAA